MKFKLVETITARESGYVIVLDGDKVLLDDELTGKKFALGDYNDSETWQKAAIGTKSQMQKLLNWAYQVHEGDYTLLEVEAKDAQAIYNKGIKILSDFIEAYNNFYKLLENKKIISTYNEINLNHLLSNQVDQVVGIFISGNSADIKNMLDKLANACEKVVADNIIEANTLKTVWEPLWKIVANNYRDIPEYLTTIRKQKNIHEEFLIDSFDLSSLKNKNLIEELEMKFKLVEAAESKICCICKKPFDGYGNNAEPVCSGSCCDECNIERVIPMRFKMIKSTDKGYRKDPKVFDFDINDRVAERWNDGEFNVGTVIDIKEENGKQYLVKWDYSDGPSEEWLYGDVLTNWIEEMDESLNESLRNPKPSMFKRLCKSSDKALCQKACEIMYDWYSNEDAFDDFSTVSEFIDYVSADIYDMIDAATNEEEIEIVLAALSSSNQDENDLINFIENNLDKVFEYFEVSNLKELLDNAYLDEISEELTNLYEKNTGEEVPFSQSISFFRKPFKKFLKNQGITKIDESLNEGNPVSGKIPESIDSFLQDIAQMYQTIDYGNIMDHDYSEDDIKKLKSLRRKFREEAQYEGNEEAEAAMNDVAEKVAAILKAKNESKELNEASDTIAFIDFSDRNVDRTATKEKAKADGASQVLTFNSVHDLIVAAAERFKWDIKKLVYTNHKEDFKNYGPDLITKHNIILKDVVTKNTSDESLNESKDLNESTNQYILFGFNHFSPDDLWEIKDSKENLEALISTYGGEGPLEYNEIIEDKGNLLFVEHNDEFISVQDTGYKTIEDFKKALYNTLNPMIQKDLEAGNEEGEYEFDMAPYYLYIDELTTTQAAVDYAMELIENSYVDGDSNSEYRFVDPKTITDNADMAREGLGDVEDQAWDDSWEEDIEEYEESLSSSKEVRIAETLYKGNSIFEDYDDLEDDDFEDDEPNDLWSALVKDFPDLEDI